MFVTVFCPRETGDFSEVLPCTIVCSLIILAVVVNNYKRRNVYIDASVQIFHVPFLRSGGNLQPERLIRLFTRDIVCYKNVLFLLGLHDPSARLSY